jgi:hypothetical protein
VGDELRSLRELARHADIELADFWRAFWLGVFEKRGRTRLQIAPAFSRESPATRKEVALMNAFGAAELLTPPDATPEQRYALLAEVPYYDVHPTFRHDFERMRVPQSEVEKWLEGPNSPTGTNIKRVLTEAAKRREADPSISFNRIAAQLTNRSEQFAGYSLDSIRKILAGKYPLQRRLGIPGLRGWRRAGK